jgi:photosystem II stability/assembly factor-like uncharacterized protein
MLSDSHVGGPLAACILLVLSTTSGAQTWFQTDWSGGPGQLTWTDSTMYYSGIHEDAWRPSGDLKLDTPDDSGWANTGDLLGATGVRSLVETSDGVLYAGTQAGGDVLKSVDAGTTWANTGDLAGATFTLSLLEASDGALYAGTSTNGDVFKSTDAGTTWVNTGDLAGAFSAPCLLETSDGALYAGTALDGDVFRSTDAGTTWVNTGELAGATFASALLETSDGTLYAGTQPNGDVFRSVDAGTTWVNTGDLAGAERVFTLLEASNGALYAATYPDGNVFESADAGTTWVNTGDLAGATYALSLVEGSNGAFYAGTYPDGNVFESADAGTTWVNTGDLAGATEVDALIEDSNGALYAGTFPNGDVFKTGYHLSGELVSSVYETGNASVAYGVINWNETLNDQTADIRVRTDTLPDMSAAIDWDSCPPTVNGQDISDLTSVNDGDFYIQYLIRLSTTRNDATPVLHDIGIEYVVDLEGPVPDPAVASDGTNPVPGIDDDDYVYITFDQPTNKPVIDALNIDSVLALTGGHTWLDGFSSIDSSYWNPPGDMLLIELSVNISPPTVAVGDTITPDGLTITDEWGNPAVSTVVLTGSFSPPGVDESAHMRAAEAFALSQNEPNPFSTRTAISYSLPSATHVMLEVYSLSGALVETLVDETQRPGTHETSWNADGKAAGIYFCRLRSGDFTSTRKMVVID